MPKPRKAQVSLDTTPYYHCVARCVRRAYLCGRDDVTGADYSHRRQWIEERMFYLATMFAVDICAYAVMSNHVHIILHVDQDRAAGWSLDDVIQRWHALFKGTSQSQRYLRGDPLAKAEMEALGSQASVWRERLHDISWYMRCLNEAIAREANREDGCTGRFWEGRFKCQALLDEKALAACMAYVDLNPVRAGMADTPESSNYTSVRRRIMSEKPNAGDSSPNTLFPFVGNPRHDMPKGLPFHLKDYLQLVDWTGRQLRAGKKGSIDGNLPPILERLDIDSAHWVFMASHFESRFKSLVGTAYKLKAACQRLGYRRISALSECQRLLG